MGDDKFIELIGKKLSQEISSEEEAELQHCLANNTDYRQQYGCMGCHGNAGRSQDHDRLSDGQFAADCRQRESVGAPREAKSQRFLQAAGAVSIAPGRFQGGGLIR